MRLKINEALSKHIGPPMTAIGVLIALAFFAYVFCLFSLLWFKEVWLFVLFGLPAIVALIVFAFEQNVRSAPNQWLRLFGFLQFAGLLVFLGYMAWIILQRE
jgi:4-hydroxybenzoate polyprenyltransferase